MNLLLLRTWLLPVVACKEQSHDIAERTRKLVLGDWQEQEWEALERAYFGFIE